ncbi:MAG: NAD-binding protein [Akkermansiaceae bacterium]|jgi:3-hydroxyisobutyrate dehydrogenase-like beta-hydroxyacid dehydrogenase|nr:NAD-binding protein [Akkermansiaceae bacterium]|tara:strand:+ start:100 stop:933 length:834 start_codon:yes stop_codon:yes gene_type:complete
MSDTIGILGLGLIGSAVAARLNAADYKIVGFDPAVPKMQGVTSVCSPNEVFSRSEFVILCLPDGNYVQAVIDEVQSIIHERHLIINTTTGDANRPHAQMIEATIGGSSALLRDGAAPLFLGGYKAQISCAQPILDILSSRSFHLGDFGAGAKFKLIHNMAIGLNRAVAAETLCFAEALGFDLNQSLDILLQSPASSTAMAAKGQRMIEAEYQPPQARLAQHLKDVRLILAAAEETSTKVPLTQLHRELLSLAELRGFGDADNAAIIEAYREDKPCLD